VLKYVDYTVRRESILGSDTGFLAGTIFFELCSLYPLNKEIKEELAALLCAATQNRLAISATGPLAHCAVDGSLRENDFHVAMDSVTTEDITEGISDSNSSPVFGPLHALRLVRWA